MYYELFNVKCVLWVCANNGEIRVGFAWDCTEVTGEVAHTRARIWWWLYCVWWHGYKGDGDPVKVEAGGDGRKDKNYKLKILEAHQTKIKMR